MKASIAVIGLAVMGENLALNIEGKGYTVAIFDIRPEQVNQFIGSRGKEKHFIPAYDLRELVDTLERPRKILMMIKAGAAVDEVMQRLLPLLDKGDIIIDGGNSNFADTERRTKEAEAKGFFYIGTGVSGGEEGALNGPSIMPGGSAQAWPMVRPLLQNIAAKVNGVSCCDWIGSGGAGHFVKMVHNGIEYGDMQLICEIYDIMRKYLRMDNASMSLLFEDWNQGVLSSYLMEITAGILRYQEPDGTYLVNNIADTAAQKGTGKWTGITALTEGVPLTLITEAVFARCLSSQKKQRTEAGRLFGDLKEAAAECVIADKDTVIKNLHDALYAAKIISYAQGFELIKTADMEYGWQIDPGTVALLWRGGCIIRSVFLEKIAEAYRRNKELHNLITDEYFADILRHTEQALRQTVILAAASGIPAPALSAALAWFDGIRSSNLPANLLQAQRDYFGAHTYERIDKPAGEFFHTNWTGHGGSTASTSYSL